MRQLLLFLFIQAVVPDGPIPSFFAIALDLEGFFELCLIEFGVHTALFDQNFVLAPLNNLSVLDDKDLVGRKNRR